MRIIAASTLIAITALAAPAAAQSFIGEWTATAETPGGPISEILTVSKTEDGHAITVAPVPGLPPPVPEGTPEAGPGENIVLEGDSFSYTRTLTTPEGSLELVYEGVVDGDTFTGTVAIFGAEVPYVGVRN